MDDSHNARHDSMPLFHSLFVLTSSYFVLGTALFFPRGKTEDMLTNVSLSCSSTWYGFCWRFHIRCEFKFPENNL